MKIIIGILEFITNKDKKLFIKSVLPHHQRMLEWAKKDLQMI
jgi:hypothetical protein